MSRLPEAQIPDTVFVISRRGKDGRPRQESVEGKMSEKTIEIYLPDGRIGVKSGVVLHQNGLADVLVDGRLRVWEIRLTGDDSLILSSIPDARCVDVQRIIRKGDSFRGPTIGG